MSAIIQKSVRTQVSEVLGTINSQFKNLDANACSEYANLLASLLPNILDKEAETEGICAMYQVALLDDPDKKYSVAETKLRLMATPEFIEFRKVRALRIGVESTIQTLKKRIAVKISEEQNQPSL